MDDESLGELEDLSEVSDDDLLNEYDRISKQLFGRYPQFPTRLSADYVLFTRIAEELGERGYQLRGIDGVEVYEKEYGTPLPDFIEQDFQVYDDEEEEVDSSDPAEVVAGFCRALINKNYSRASSYCHPQHFNELLEDTYGEPGRLDKLDPSGECVISQEYMDKGAVRYCDITIKVMWDYGGGPEPEELDFRLARLDGEWKIIKPDIT
ncbi:MAG: hypothetical protein JW738_08075 [Actinobacteria bacterium]|nr:hypothetical protein [Actinomycetota bacterium]